MIGREQACLHLVLAHCGCLT